MCLISRQSVPITAENDIEIYKMFNVFETGNSSAGYVYWSPFADYKFEEGENLAKGYTSFGEPYAKWDGSPVFNVFKYERGFFHAYVDKISVISRNIDEFACLCFEDLYKGLLRHVYLIVTFPKGSRIVVGVNGDICADKLIFPAEPKPMSAIEFFNMMVKEAEEEFGECCHFEIGKDYTGTMSEVLERIRLDIRNFIKTRENCIKERLESCKVTAENEQDATDTMDV